MSPGFSGTPLARKLDLRDGQICWFDGMPEHIHDEIDEYALELSFVSGPEESPDAVHIFVHEITDLEAKLAKLRQEMASDGQIWVSWPSEGSGRATDIDEDAIRAAGAALDFVATKTCEIDDAWSGLKLVISKEMR